MRVAVALGSNLGDREAFLDGAVTALRPVLDGIRVSAFHGTVHVGQGVQPDYLNGALTGETPLPPRALMGVLLEIERASGRTRPFVDAPRTIDLDLILYGAVILAEPGLTVPHPRFRQRRFVLEPLAEIAGDWVDPVTGRTVEELLRALVT